MKYIEFEIIIPESDKWRDVMIAHLFELGFDSFTETPEGVLAYVQEVNFIESDFNQFVENQKKNGINLNFQSKEMPNINWNEEWEKNFNPIVVEGQIHVRAEFHPPKDLAHEIIIQPKMAFGTGHHATTYLMLKNMLLIDFINKNVLDMGCGTAILSIFAKKRGAKNVLAIDIDSWATENSIENCERNAVKVDVLEGDVNLISDKKFDIILANINKNILLQDIPHYAHSLETGGILIISGIYNFDFEDIIKVCTISGLVEQSQTERDNWISVILMKK